MAELPSKPRRRFLSFSLRSLLLLLAVIALPVGWLAGQRREVRDRKELLPWIVSNGTYCDDEAFLCCERSGSGSPELEQGLLDIGKAWNHRAYAHIPVFRKFIGDEPIQFILLESKVTTADFRRTERSFPEALVWRCRQSQSP